MAWLHHQPSVLGLQSSHNLSISSVWRFAIGSFFFLPLLVFFISRSFLCSPGWFWTMLGLQVASTNAPCYSFLKKKFKLFSILLWNFPISCFPLYFLVNIFFLKIIFILYILIMFPLPQFFPHPPDLPTHQTLFFFSLFKRNKSFFKNLLQKHKNGNQNNQKANKTKPRRSQNKTKW